MTLRFGASVRPQTTDEFDALNSGLNNQLRVIRSFNSGVPTAYWNGEWSAFRTRAEAGQMDIVASFKPSATTAQSTLEGLANSCPQGAELIVYHEPEDNFPDGSGFLSLFDRTYDIMKAVRPDLKIGYAAMAYQWGVGQNATSSTTVTARYQQVADMADFVSVDVYFYSWQSAYTNLANHTDFQRWHQNIAVRKPSGFRHVHEFGVKPGTGRPQTYTDSVLWADVNGYGTFLHWNTVDSTTQENWRINEDPATLTAFRDVMAQVNTPPPPPPTETPEQAYQRGYNDGHAAGYDEGFAVGNADGLEAGYADAIDDAHAAWGVS